MTQPPTSEPYAPPPPPTTTHGSRSGVGAGRHLVSVVLSVVAMPLVYLGVDFAFRRGLLQRVQTGLNELPPFEAMLGLVLACTAMFVAVAAGRLSGLGPLVSGLVMAGLPALLILVRPRGFGQFIADLPAPYNGAGFGIITVGPLLFPLLTAVLLGAAINGRWRS